MMKRIVMLSLLILLALAMSSYAEDMTASKVEAIHYIEYGAVLVDTRVYFEDPVSAEIEFILPFDAKAITLRVDGQPVDFSLDRNLVSYQFEDNTNLRLQYISEAFLEKESFLATISPPVSTEEFFVRVSLPAKAVLHSPFRKGMAIPSVVPTPDRLETDGQSIDVVWHFTDITKAAEIPVMIRYLFPGRLSLVLVSSFAAVLLLLVIFYFAIARKKGRKGPKVILVKQHKRARSEPGIANHLKEDEEQIVTILKKRECKCEQGTLRVITGFSKAKLSGLLKELEERKIVYKEKRGKKNLVFLKD